MIFHLGVDRLVFFFEKHTSIYTKTGGGGGYGIICSESYITILVNNNINT